MNNSVGMKIFQGIDNLHSIALNLKLVKSLTSFE